MLARNKVALVLVGLGIAAASAYAIGTSDAVVARILRAQLGRHVRAPCSFESASFTFLHGLEVGGLTVLDPDDPLGTPLIAAEHGHLDYVLDVFGTGPRIKSVDIERPRVHLVRAADGTLPLHRAFFFPTPEGDAPKPRVRLAGGEMTFWDPTILAGEPLALRDIEVDVTPGAPGSGQTHVDVRAASDVLGPVAAQAVLAEGRPAVVTIDLARTRLEPSLPGRFAGDLGRLLAQLAPTGEVTTRVTTRIDGGRYVDPEATVEIHDAAFRIALPEKAPGATAPAPIDVTGLNGHLRLAGDRVESTDLVLRALGAEFRAEAALVGATSASPTLDAKATVRRLVFTRAARDVLPRAARRVVEAYDLAATIDATVTARGPVAAPVVTVDASATDGHVRYEGYLHEDGRRQGFPWDADDVAAKVTFDGSTLRLVEVTGRHGPARVRASGVVTDGASIPDVTIVVEDVPLDDDVRRGFTDRAERIFDRWNPSGVAQRITVHVFRDVPVDGEHDVVDVTIDCDGRAGFRPQLLPEQLSEVSGRVEIVYPVVDGRREELVRLTGIAGRAEGFRVAVAGEVRDGDREDLVVSVDTEDAGGNVRAAALGAPDATISPGVKDAIRKIGASGPVGVVAHLVVGADGVRRDEVAVTLRGTSVAGWDDVHLAANGLTGRAVVAGETVTFEDVAGRFALGGFSPAFTGRGRLLGISGDPKFDVHLEATEIPLGEPLRAALGPIAKTAAEFWERVRPVGTARADAVLDLRPGTDATPVEIRLTRIRGGLQPLGLELDNADGTLHYDGRHAQLTLDSAIGAAEVRIEDADYDFATKRASIRASVRGLHFPEDLEGPLSAETVAKIADAAPGRALHASDLVISYQPDPATVEIAGDLSIRPRSRRPVPDPGYAPDGRLVVHRLLFGMPDAAPVWFQGEARAEDFALRAGLAIDELEGPLVFSGTLDDPVALDVETTRAKFSVEEYPFTGADATVSLRKRGIRVHAKGKFMDGDFEAVVNPGEGPGSYRGHLSLVDADVETLLRRNAPPTQEVPTGKLSAGVTIVNDTGVRADLRGDGKAWIRHGRLMPSPIASSVLSVLSLGLGAPPMLDEAQMKFDIEGDWLLVRDLEMTGPGGAIEDGRGKIGLVGGQIDLSVQPRFDLPVPILEKVINIFQAHLIPRVHLGGTMRNPQARFEIVPGAETDRRPEPQPAGDVAAPGRDPW